MVDPAAAAVAAAVAEDLAAAAAAAAAAAGTVPRPAVAAAEGVGLGLGAADLARLASVDLGPVGVDLDPSWTYPADWRWACQVPAYPAGASDRA